MKDKSGSDVGREPALGVTHSPFQDFFGYTVSEARHHYAEMRIPWRPEFVNRTGRMHGGVLMVLIDSVGGYCGCAEDDGTLARRAVSLSVTTNFLAAPEGEFIRAVGEVTGGGRTIFFSRVTVYDAHDTVVATGEGTYKYIRFSPAETA